jgi:Ser-tRNA(Ala) deacylase AlaX
LINWLPIFKKKKSDVDSFDHERVTTGHSLLKALIQANVVADSTVAEIVDEVAATEVVAETVDEAAATEVVAETVDEVAATEVVAETVDEAAATEVVADLDNVVKAAVAVLVDIDWNPE